MTNTARSQTRAMLACGEFCWEQFCLFRPLLAFKGNVKQKRIHRWMGHCVLFHSERSILSRSFKERNVLFRSFYEILATYETQKNDAFFSVLFLRKEKNATFFCKEWKRTQRTFRSFAKNVKERKNVLFFCKRTQNVAFLFSIYIYRYI